MKEILAKAGRVLLIFLYLDGYGIYAIVLHFILGASIQSLIMWDPYNERAILYSIWGGVAGLIFFFALWHYIGYRRRQSQKRP